MYSKPIIGKGKREPLFWFKVKQVWLKIKYKDHHDKITKKEFFRNFQQYCEKYGITWDFTDKNGNPKIPDIKDYDHARKNSCFKKYAWNECFTQYEFDEMTNSDKRKRKIYQKNEEDKILKNEEQYFRIDKHIDKLLREQEEEDAHNEYRIAKDIESKNQLDEKSRQLLGLDVEDSSAENETIHIPDNPEHEEQNIRDIWTKRARSDVIPR